MTLRLDEPAFVLDLGLVSHRANTILDSGAIRSNLEACSLCLRLLGGLG